MAKIAITTDEAVIKTDAVINQFTLALIRLEAATNLKLIFDVGEYRQLERWIERYTI